MIIALEYAANAIYYIMWRWDSWQLTQIVRFLNVICFGMLGDSKQAAKRFGRNRKAFHISHTLEAMYMLFSGLWIVGCSFIAMGVMQMIYKKIALVAAIFVYIVLFLFLFYLVIYRNKYVVYFQHFQEYDKRWIKTWTTITVFYCLGAIPWIILCLAFCNSFKY